MPLPSAVSLLMARFGSPDHVAGTSAYPPTGDIVASLNIHQACGSDPASRVQIEVRPMVFAVLGNCPRDK